ncbi:HAD-like protein [Tricholoma matsutake]|nr:HAD-like protein [Tricholoma matsutake 945]
MFPPIRLVTFDALYTIITPRLPVHVQYSQTFAPYIGVLDPEALRRSFRVAFESEQPVYGKGSQAWWSEVIKRTALGAGADPKALDASLSTIVSRLMTRFGSKEGYRAFDDTIPTVQCLGEMGIMTAVISNSDSRLRAVLKDLELPSLLNPVVLSEEEGFEKPSPQIFLNAISQASQMVERQGRNPIMPEECLHVGDELES